MRARIFRDQEQKEDFLDRLDRNHPHLSSLLWVLKIQKEMPWSLEFAIERDKHIAYSPYTRTESDPWTTFFATLAVITILVMIGAVLFGGFSWPHSLDDFLNRLMS